jgi:hypothetical protein
VLVALGWYNPRFLEGIGRCARECQWHLASRPLLEASDPGEWQGDGLLVNVGNLGTQKVSEQRLKLSAHLLSAERIPASPWDTWISHKRPILSLRSCSSSAWFEGTVYGAAREPLGTTLGPSFARLLKTPHAGPFLKWNRNRPVGAV